MIASGGTRTTGPKLGFDAPSSSGSTKTWSEGTLNWQTCGLAHGEMLGEYDIHARRRSSGILSIPPTDRQPR